MWLRMLIAKSSPAWPLGAVVLCVAAFAVGVMASCSSDGPVTAEQRPIPQSVDLPRPTPLVLTTVPAPQVATEVPTSQIAKPNRYYIPPAATPHIAEPPPRPTPTVEEHRRISNSLPEESPITEYIVGKTTAGSTIRFLNGKTLKLPRDVYVSGKAHYMDCAVGGTPCPKLPVYNLTRDGVEISLDGDGNLIPESNRGVDLSQFSFINDIKGGP